MWSSVFSKSFLKRLPLGLALALLLSLLVHLVILGSEYWHLPSLDVAQSNHQVQQIHLQAAPLAELPPAPKPQPAPKPKPAAEQAQPPASQPLPEMAAQQPITDFQPMDEMPAVDVAPANEPQADDSVGPLEDAGLAEAPETEAHEMPAFSYVDTEFVVLRGENGSKIGVTKISYRMQENGRYELTSTTEAKGLAALVVAGKLLQQSEGVVTSEGLQPQFFSYQYGKGENKKQQSRFDWEQHTVTLESAKGVKTVALPAGSQDLLSFMYQFIFTPPLEQLTLHISNGKKLSEYSYSFEGEETLNAEFGSVRTWHIAHAGQTGHEKTELWLAIDYHYLPVKMRKTEEDGSVIEQLATSISTDLLK